MRKCIIIICPKLHFKVINKRARPGSRIHWDFPRSKHRGDIRRAWGLLGEIPMNNKGEDMGGVGRERLPWRHMYDICGQREGRKGWRGEASGGADLGTSGGADLRMSWLGWCMGSSWVKVKRMVTENLVRWSCHHFAHSLAVESLREVWSAANARSNPMRLADCISRRQPRKIMDIPHCTRCPGC